MTGSENEAWGDTEMSRLKRVFLLCTFLVLIYTFLVKKDKKIRGSNHVRVGVGVGVRVTRG